MEKGFNIRRAGTGGSDLPDLPAEFSGIPHDRGTLGAARSSNPNSANSQFFINFKDNHFLNRQYTVYGRVISGMDHVDAITRGEPPMNPDRMIKVNGPPMLRNLTILVALAATPALSAGLEIVVAGEANGTITIDLFEDVAPLHVAQITALAAEGRL